VPLDSFSQDAVSIGNALYEGGRVLSCAAVAIPDARLGELSVTFVVQITEMELLNFIRSVDRIRRLATFAVLVMLVIWTDLLPTNAVGKSLKTSLGRRQQTAT
jgi:non-ribosomal peptide synthetase component E (peptide arylation enzyme)